MGDYSCTGLFYRALGGVLGHQHEEIYPLHAVLGNHLINNNRHGLKFAYVMGNGMHEWTQVLILPVY